MPEKLTIEECRETAKSRGGKCLSEEYMNDRTKMEWQCEFGHVWYATFNSIRHRKSWCPYCAGVVKKTIEDCIQEAEKRGGECLSKEYVNQRTKMEWRCKNDHTWFATFTHIKNSQTWCPYCVGQIKHTIEECKEKALENGGKCLTDVYKNSETKMQWQCKCGYIWKANFNDILRGRWCGSCAKNIKKTIEDCEKLAKANNGKLLSTEYKGNAALLEWECDQGHTWMTSYANVLSGTWCPGCSSSRTQKFIESVVKNMFPNMNVFCNYRGFDWLKTKRKGKQELDIFVPELKLAIEYDGQQHFIPVRYGSMSEEKAKERLKKIKLLDKEKNRKVKKHKNDVKYFIRFNYMEDITKEYVIKKLNEIGVMA